MRAPVACGILLLFLALAHSEVESFRPFTEIDLGEASGEVVVVDVTGDGRPDIVTTATWTQKVVIHENTGGGTFAPYAVTVPGDLFRSFGPADLDGDGDTDLFFEVAYLASDTVEPALAVLRNDGEGGFTVSVMDLDHRLNFHALGDLDGDGDVDVVFNGDRHKEPPGLDTLLNDGSGAFAPGPRIPTAKGPERHALGDLDGDGLPELAVDAHGGIYLYRNLGALAFSAPVLIDGVRDHPRFADVDGDGHLDLLAPKSGSSAALTISWGSETGDLSAPEIKGTAVSRIAVRRAFHALDLDGDGDLELVTPGMRSFVTVRDNLTGRTFGDTLLHRFTDVSMEFEDAFAADLDGDGRRELFLHRNGGTAYVLEIGGRTPPRILSLSPTEAESGATVTLTVTGTGLAPDLALAFSGSGIEGLEILDVAYDGPEQLRATVRTPVVGFHEPEAPFGGSWVLHAEDPAGGASISSDRFSVDPFWDGAVGFVRGDMKDTSGRGRDRFRVKGRLVRSPIRTITDQAGQDLTLRYGAPDALHEIRIPGDDPGWRLNAKRTRLRYRSRKGPRPEVRLDFRGAAKPKVRIDVRRTDLAPDPSGQVRVEIWIGDQRLMGTRAFTEIRPGRFKYRLK